MRCNRPKTEEAGGGRIVVAGIHVQQAGRIRYTACERHLVEERIARAGRHAELVVVVGLDDGTYPVHDRRDAAADVVPVVEAPVCDIQWSGRPVCMDIPAATCPSGFSLTMTVKALPEFYMKPISLNEPLLFYNL